MATFGEAALAAAVADLGVTEHPPGSNWGPRVSQYLKSAGFKSPAPWCMAAVHFWFKQAGVDLGGGASVGNFETWARQHGDLVYDPQPGDIVCYRFDADNWPDHVGIVESATSKSITVIEGNTSYGNDANGGTVMRRVRRINRCTFARIPGHVPEPAEQRVDVVRDGRLWLVGQRVSNTQLWARVKGAAGKARLTIRKAA